MPLVGPVIFRGSRGGSSDCSVTMCSVPGTGDPLILSSVIPRGNSMLGDYD